MSSLPNSSSTHLSTPLAIRRNNHRHRRSAAISGDFDIMGLGLFSPTDNISKQHQSNNSHHQSPSISTHVEQENINSYNNNHNNNDAESNYDNDLNRHFRFNNDDDFSNKPKSDDFSFPNKTPDLTSISTPPRYFSSSNKRMNPTHNLNSPIKLNHRKTVSTSIPKTKFFLTEETHVNSENVPDAVIDLDEIFNANLHIGDDNGNSNRYPSNIHKRTELLPHDIFGNNDADFLASPSLFFKQHQSNSFASSPLSAPHNITLFQQPIQEQASDSIEEEDDDDDVDDEVEVEEDDVDADEHDESVHVVNSVSRTNDSGQSDNENETFTNPQDTIGGLYSNSSANSSNSSLKSVNGNLSNHNHRFPSNHVIEKSISNSSKDSVNSGNTNFVAYSNSTPTSKRSGAKANRYQSFYDQSFKITNALKFSSSESINIIRSNSTGQNNNLLLNPNNSNSGNNINNASKSLGHSSSLPSLKTNLNRNPNNTPRYVESRFRQEGRKFNSPPTFQNNFSPGAIHGFETESPQRSNHQKSSTYLSNTDNSTYGRNLHYEHSSPLIYSVDSKSLYNTSAQNQTSTPVQDQTILTTHDDSTTPVRSSSHQKPQPQPHPLILGTKNISNSPISVASDISSTVISTNETSTDHSSVLSQNENSVSNSKKLKDRESYLSSDNATPSIVVSKHGDVTSSSSTNSTFRQLDDDTVDIPLVSSILNKSDESDSNQIKVNHESNEVEGEESFTKKKKSAHLPSIIIPPPSSLTSSVMSTPITISTPPPLISDDSSSASPKSSFKKKSSRRQLSPTEEKILKMTQIPTFKSSPQSQSDRKSNKENTNPHNLFSSYTRKSLASSTVTQPLPFSISEAHNQKYRHSKSKSFSLVMLDLTPGISRHSTNEEVGGERLTKSKNNKLINWFRKKR